MRIKPLQKGLAFGSVLLATTAMSPASFAQNSSENDQVVQARQAEELDLDLEEIVVIGSLRNVAEALRRQRESDNLINVIASGDFGKLPDFNAAEALQRLPGISLVQEQGEGRFVSIRGARPNYNGTLLNGFTIPSGDRDERRVDLQTVSNSLIESIEVTKAATPDQPAEGIGGVVNIQQRNPADLEGFVAGGSAFTGLQQYDGFDILADAYTGARFGSEDQFGFTIAGNYRYGERDGYLSETDDWTTATASNGQQVDFPEFFNTSVFPLKRHNKGVEAAFGAVYDDFRFEVRGVYSRFFQPNTENDLRAETTVATDPITGEVLDFDASGGLVTGDIIRVAAYDEWRLTLKGVQTRAEAQLNENIKLDLGYSYLKAREYYALRDTVVGSASFDTPLEMNISPDAVGFAPITGNVPDILRSSSIPVASLRDRPRYDDEDEHAPRLDLTYTYDTSGEAEVAIKAGLYYRFREKSGDNIFIFPINDGTSPLNLRDLAGGEEITNVRGLGTYFGYLTDKDLLRQNIENPPSGFSILPVGQVPGLDNSDYIVDENIFAHYGMVTVGTGRFTGIAGVRYEKTNVDLLVTSDETESGLQTISGDDDHWLPSVHMKYEVMDDIILRASWSNTVARPDAQTIYGRETIDRVDRVISRPNPALEPLESSNFDASVEYYFGPLNYVTFGGFYKDIDNFPLATSSTVQFEGESYTLSTVQAGIGGKIKGLEAAYRQQFDFLSGWMSGFGFDINAAIIDSEADYDGRADKPRLQQQPDLVVNAALTYADEIFFARLAMAHRSEQIDRGGISEDGPDNDFYLSSRTTLDFSANYSLTDQLQIFAEIKNITNAPERGYFGNPSRFGLWESFGTSGGIGVRWAY